MEILEAIKVIRALADGVNPETGEVLEANSNYQNPQVVRALHRALEGLDYLEKREKAKQSQPKNAWKPWSSAEDEQVCDELRQGIDFNQIAKTHNRSLPSIIARLVKLGKISPDKSAMFPPKIA